MKNVELNIGNLSIQLESDNAHQLQSLAEEINKKIAQVKKSYGNITDIKAILITMLLMQDEMINIKSSIGEDQDLVASFYGLLDSITHKIEELSTDLKS